MAFYNYTVSEFNPAEVPAGGMIACHALLFHFDLHDGDKDLYFISGQISNAVDGSTYTLVNGHFTDLVEGWFEVAIPTTVTAGEYSVFAYFGALDYHVADQEPYRLKLLKLKRGSLKRELSLRLPKAFKGRAIPLSVKFL